MPIGPSTTTAPYLLADEPNVTIISIATVGDVIGTKSDGTPYRFVGIPDGLGAYDNGDGTISVLINHELLGTIYNLSGGIVVSGVGIEREIFRFKADYRQGDPGCGQRFGRDHPSSPVGPL
jgi:hypothetical protein